MTVVLHSAERYQSSDDAILYTYNVYIFMTTEIDEALFCCSLQIKREFTSAIIAVEITEL